MKSLVTYQFSYCPLIWTLHSRHLNNEINSMHERALRITYQDNTSTFKELLNKDNSVSIHHRNVEVLATEMFKIYRGLSPEILRDTLVPKTSLYNLRRNDTFEKRKVYSVYHSSKLLSFLGSYIIIYISSCECVSVCLYICRYVNFLWLGLTLISTMR